LTGSGLALDNNNIILVFIFLFESTFNQGVFSIILYISGLGLAALNVSELKTPKLSGNPVVLYCCYQVLVLCISTHQQDQTH
jgi:CDP-diacylglycerol--serine O-phosphatidyltransferase